MRKKRDRFDNEEYQEYKREEGKPHRDCHLNYKASKWFVEKYLETFAPYISSDLMIDNNLEESYLGYKFNYQKQNTTFFTIVNFHQDYETCKGELCDMCRTLMRAIGMKDAFYIEGWSNFLRCAVSYIDFKEKALSLNA